MAKKNLWLLTEECPKVSVISSIVSYYFSCILKLSVIVQPRLCIIPILDSNNVFTFTYEVHGFISNHINRVFIKIVSGNSSFLDYLLFYQDNMPIESIDKPVLCVEVTKTDDSESRNTGIYQRGSKFVYCEHFYPNVPKVMYYNLSKKQKLHTSPTNIFGVRLLLTLGVIILGNNNTTLQPFANIDDLINLKNSLKAKKDNKPITLKKVNNSILFSIWLEKKGSASYDPNIGAFSVIVACLRRLNFTGPITVINHGLLAKMLSKGNKLTYIASINNITFDKITNYVKTIPSSYWYYEKKSEKIATIFVDIIVNTFTEGTTIYDNHAGSERGYFFTPNGDPITIEKYTDRSAYKSGNKNAIYFLPDLILLDPDELEIINIEGKQYCFVAQGIAELNNYTPIENDYILPHYPNYKILRTVVLYGGNATGIPQKEVSLLLNATGDLILGIDVPSLISLAANNLFSFWH